LSENRTYSISKKFYRMKAIVFDKIGSPSDVLRLSDVPVPEVAEGEVLVKMIAASINPGDFLVIQNLYPDPKKPHFPGQIAGNHGAGIITKTGKNVSLKPGTLVAFSYYNTWAEYAAVPAEWLIPLPATTRSKRPPNSSILSPAAICSMRPGFSRANGWR
jgi:NADPH2:quinone reductase